MTTDTIQNIKESCLSIKEIVRQQEDTKDKRKKLCPKCKNDNISIGKVLGSCLDCGYEDDKREFKKQDKNDLQEIVRQQGLQETTQNKYKIGDKVIYHNKIRTIKEIQQKDDTYYYLLNIKNYPFLFIKEGILKPYAEITELQEIKEQGINNNRQTREDVKLKDKPTAEQIIRDLK